MLLEKLANISWGDRMEDDIISKVIAGYMDVCMKGINVLPKVLMDILNFIVIVGLIFCMCIFGFPFFLIGLIWGKEDDLYIEKKR